MKPSISTLPRTLSRVAAIRFVAVLVPLVGALALTLGLRARYVKHQLSIDYLPALDYGATLALCAAMLGLYALLVRALERRWPQELALRSGVAWAGRGALIGCALFCSVYLVFGLLGIANWGGVRGVDGVVTVAVLAILAAVGEELIFRGVLFRIVEDSFGTGIAIAISAALFGLLHAGNPGATAVSSLAIALEAGVLLAVAYAWSRSLWFTIGLHFAWNFTEGGVFGAAISGGGSHGLLNVPVSQSAPVLLTGGAFGPEASIVAVAVCLCAAVMLGLATVRAGRWRRVSFRMMLD